MQEHILTCCKNKTLSDYSFEIWKVCNIFHTSWHFVLKNGWGMILTCIHRDCVKDVSNTIAHMKLFKNSVTCYCCLWLLHRVRPSIFTSLCSWFMKSSGRCTDNTVQSWLGIILHFFRCSLISKTIWMLFLPLCPVFAMCSSSLLQVGVWS